MTEQVVSPGLQTNTLAPGEGPGLVTQSAIQGGIYQALVAASEITCPVYDDVPQGAAYPYIVIGDDTAIAFDDDCGVGLESTLTLHVWSVYSGRKEAKDIMAAIYEVLHLNKLPLSSGYTVICMLDFMHTFLDPDGVTRHGVIRFRLLTRSFKNG